MLISLFILQIKNKNQSSEGLNYLSEPYTEKLKGILDPGFLIQDFIFPHISQNSLSLQISLIFHACFYN